MVGKNDRIKSQYIKHTNFYGFLCSIASDGCTFALWIAVFLWTIAIYFLSAQAGEISNNQSILITRQIIMILGVLGIIDTGADMVFSTGFNGIVRQISHSMIYLILADLVFLALTHTVRSGIVSFVTEPIRLTHMKLAYILVTSFIICLAYAIADEIHQLFVPGRAFQAIDLVYDA